ncbi:MAG: hypothetical protein PHD74_02885 [Candidatus Krumholzibacteria bacterium]|nr:hypothetical protein [Candidatus Krumholzibacteria bacterium]
MAAVLTLLSPSLAHAASVYVQAESFTDSYNIDPEPIISDNSMLKGLDSAGEWTQYSLEVSAFGTYSYMVRCWGDLNVAYTFRITTAPVQGGEPQSVEFSYIGKGSCGS